VTAPDPARAQADGPGPVTSVPPTAAAARVCSALEDHPRWSAFWDKRHGVWRVAEDDPDSALYAESSDADIVIGYIEATPDPPCARPPSPDAPAADPRPRW
jgi:hypothetical protein